MVKTTFWVGSIAVAMALTVGCSKKEDSKGTKQSAKSAPVADPAAKQGNPDTPTKPGKSCAAGELADGDNCVKVVSADQLQAVKSQAQRVDTLASTLDKAAVLAGPIEIINAMRKLEAWQKLAKTSDQFGKVDKTIEVLNAAVTELNKTKATLRNTKGSLDQIAVLLGSVVDGKAALATLTQTRAKISAELKKAIEPLQAQVKSLVDKALVPAKQELEKLKAMRAVMCAPVAFGKGGADLKKLCKSSEDAVDAAVGYVKALEKQPDKMMSDLVAALNANLDKLVDQQVKPLLKVN